MADRIKIFCALNHIGNEYEVLKIAKSYPVKFYYLENNVRRWSKYSARPEPTTWLTKDEFEWVTYYEPSKYDLAILRLDQQHIDPLIGKGQLFRQMNEVIRDIPKIVVNHGTPMYAPYDEQTVKYGGEAQTSKGNRKLDGIRDMINDCKLMIVNSYDAIDRWGFEDFPVYPLIHSMDSTEWFDLSKEPRVILPLSPGGLDEYYNRSLCTAIKSAVKERTGIDVMHTNVNVHFDNDNWREYREFLGSSLIAIFPFKDSPMPRSRSEAMLSGCCVLSSRYHNATEFIKHGMNGFIMPDNPLSYAEAIHTLINECYRDAVAMGQRGKKTAQQIFQPERFMKDFYHVIYEVANNRVPTWDGSKVWDNLIKQGV